MPAIPSAEMGWEDSLFADICSWPYAVPPEAQLIMLTFRGDPLPSPRPRVTRTGTFMPTRYRTYREGLKWSIKGALLRRGVPPSDSNQKYGFKAAFFRATRQRTDVDNLLKTVSDAGTGIVWADDSQVLEVFGRVFVDPDNPRVVILIYAVAEPEGDLKARQFTCVRCEAVVTCDTPAKARMKKYCSDACRCQRIEKTCLQCSKKYSLPPSLDQKGFRKVCSRECSVAYLRETRKSNAKPQGKCSVCGGAVSRTSYKRCKACQLAGIQPKASQFDWLKPVDETKG
jgi:Holliday junction resolvase RusA-like endonuclease